MSKASRAAARRRARGGLVWSIAGGAVVVVALALVARAWLFAPTPPSVESGNFMGSQTAAVEVEEWGDFG